MTEIFNSISVWQTFRKNLLFADKSVGFVPTMGNLHAGHLSLLERSVAENEMTVLSIFINPTQFDNKQDHTAYPKTFERDVELAKQVGVDFILVPDYLKLYPDDYRYRVVEGEFSKQMEGAFRSKHFDGVLTVVLKLLLLVKPKKAYFGEKDFQQLQLVEDMVEAFFLDTEIIASPTIRDENGFALSSRNSRLSAEQYEAAKYFPKLLASDLSIAEIIVGLKERGFVVDYVEEHVGRRFGAVNLGSVRLIDNFKLTDGKL
jgi:pantoate--beta-alanine ligase